MELFYIILGFLAYSGFVLTEECDSDEPEKCIKELLRTMQREGLSGIDCKVLKKTEACLKEVGDRCVDGDFKGIYEEQVEKMQNSIKKFCAKEERGEFLQSERKTDDIDLIECLDDGDKLMPFAMECNRKIKSDLVHGNARFGYNLKVSDTMCSTYLAIAECVSGKVGDHCGREVEKPFFYGMMVALKQQNPRAARSSKCARVINEAEDIDSWDSQLDGLKRKKRSVENTQFQEQINDIIDFIQ